MTWEPRRPSRELRAEDVYCIASVTLFATGHWIAGVVVAVVGIITSRCWYD